MSGWHHVFWRERYLRHPVLMDFCAREGISPGGHDVLVTFCEHMIDDALDSGVIKEGGERNVVMALNTPPTEGARRHAAEVYAEILRRTGRGVTGHLWLSSAPAEELTFRELDVYLGERRVHLLLVRHQALPQSGAALAADGPDTRLQRRAYADVGRQAQPRPAFGERGAGGVDGGGPRADPRPHPLDAPGLPPHHHLARGRGAVPRLSAGSPRRHGPQARPGPRRRGRARGAVPGAGRLGGAVREAVEEGGWIVQERVESRPYFYPPRPGAAPVPHTVIWGLFCTGSRYGGACLRMLPQGVGDGIVSGTRGAYEGTILEI